MLTSLAMIFLMGLILGAVFQRLKLPSLLGMLITGMILGPHMLNMLDKSILSISTDLRQLALVIILTRAGLSLKISDIKKVGRPAVFMSFVPACLEIAGIMLFAPLLLGVSLLDAALMGAVVAAVSPAVIVPRMIKLIKEGYGKEKGIPGLILAGASVDDVFVIVLFTVFASLATGGKVMAQDLLQVPVSIFTGLLVGGSFGYLLTLFFRKIHIRDSAKVIIFMGISFLMLELAHRMEGVIPFSGLLAIMSMGIVLNQFYNTLAGRLSEKFDKLWVAAEIILFVLVGATVDLSYALMAGFPSLIVLMLALLFRMAGVMLSLIKTRLSAKERLFCMIAYIPKATVQAAIGAIPLSMGLESGQIILSVAVLSILITAPAGAFGIDRLYKRLLT